MLIRSLRGTSALSVSRSTKNIHAACFKIHQVALDKGCRKESHWGQGGLGLFPQMVLLVQVSPEVETWSHRLCDGVAFNLWVPHCLKNNSFVVLKIGFCE